MFKCVRGEFKSNRNITTVDGLFNNIKCKAFRLIHWIKQYLTISLPIDKSLENVLTSATENNNLLLSF